ncbi:hypothetical protein FRB97_007562 [Tulasnella sp. 331]|nr:hypothetical protein FRB97_007562 [Tulasnella sp. 331]KAG8874732.1 hypothetical protein FRB98_008252 [Tulasnella sp. 332]
MFSSSSYDPKAETPDLTGRIAVVTGGNAGIGYETVLHLASNGAKVYLASRNEQRANDAIVQLRKQGAFSKGGSVEFVQVDLSCIKEVKTAAEALAQKAPKIHILVNSAGQLAQKNRGMTKEGIVDTLATNHFGHFLWTETLLPCVKAAAAEPNSDVRIVTMASEAHKFPPKIAKIDSISDIDVSQESGMTSAMKRYGMSKLCNIWFTHELQKRLDRDNTNIVAMCVDPGSVATEGSKGALKAGAPWPLPTLVWPILKMTFSTPAVGAYSSEFAATSNKVAQDRDAYKSAYILPPNRVTPLTGQATNDALAEQLWILSEKVIKEVQETGFINP